MKHLLAIGFLSLALAAGLRAADDVVISEFMTRNNTSITDNDGSR